MAGSGRWGGGEWVLGLGVRLFLANRQGIAGLAGK